MPSFAGFAHGYAPYFRVEIEVRPPRFEQLLFARARENEPGHNISEHGIAGHFNAVDESVDLFGGEKALLLIALFEQRGAGDAILVDAGSLPLKR